MLPSLFISHGSPMLALEPGESGPALQRLAAELPRPKAIVIVSPTGKATSCWSMATRNRKPGTTSAASPLRCSPCNTRPRAFPT